MASGNFTESVVKEGALSWLEDIGWQVAHGPGLAPGTLAAEPPGARQAACLPAGRR